MNSKHVFRHFRACHRRKVLDIIMTFWYQGKLSYLTCSLLLVIGAVLLFLSSENIPWNLKSAMKLVGLMLSNLIKAKTGLQALFALRLIQGRN